MPNDYCAHFSNDGSVRRQSIFWNVEEHHCIVCHRRFSTFDILVTNYPVTPCNILGDQRPQLQHGKSLESCMSSFQLNKEVVCQKPPPRHTTIHDYYSKNTLSAVTSIYFYVYIAHQLLNTQQ
jgi:hypothetical protein